jgi:hypothetical protein
MYRVQQRVYYSVGYRVGDLFNGLVLGHSALIGYPSPVMGISSLDEFSSFS